MLAALVGACRLHQSWYVRERGRGGGREGREREEGGGREREERGGRERRGEGGRERRGERREGREGKMKEENFKSREGSEEAIFYASFFPSFSF